MTPAVVTPAEEARILNEFHANEAAREKRRKLLRRARLAPLWTSIGLILVMGVVSGMLIARGHDSVWPILVSQVVALLIWRVFRASFEAREKLFLEVIREESPVAYQRLKAEYMIE